MAIANKMEEDLNASLHSVVEGEILSTKTECFQMPDDDKNGKINFTDIGCTPVQLFMTLLTSHHLVYSYLHH